MKYDNHSTRLIVGVTGEASLSNRNYATTRLHDEYNIYVCITASACVKLYCATFIETVRSIR